MCICIWQNGCSLEGLMLKLKLQYFGHLMRRTDAFEKTLMLGKIEVRRRRGWQRMKWLDDITDSMDMSLGELWELVMNMDTWRATVPGVTKSRTQLSDWTELIYTYTYMHSFYILSPNSPYWEEFLVLYSRFLLVLYFIYVCICVYVNHNLPIYPPDPHPLVTTVCFLLHQWLCFANKFNCTFFFLFKISHINDSMYLSFPVWLNFTQYDNL